MKKRIACLVLALVMLVGMFPAGVLQVSAADRFVSEAGIKVIKEFMGFKKTAYLSGTEYLIGYGTPSIKGATITEAHADIALREALDVVDTKVNADAASAGVSLVQKQHDALVWFGYVYGTSSLSAALEAAAFDPNSSSSEIANAFCTEGYAAGYPDQKSDKALIQARMAMANLFVNGVYSASAKGTFGMTVFDAGNGAFGAAKKMVQVYDTKYTNEVTVADPTLSGKDFLGWYTKSSDGSYALVTGLNSATNGKVLYARWQEGETKVKTKYTIPASVLYIAAGKAPADVMDVCKDPSDATKIDVVKRDAMVTIVAEKLVSGIKWVELSTGGWVKLGALADIKPIVPAVKVTVTDDFVNIRDDANVNAKKVGTAKRGETLVIYMTEDVAGDMWGYTVSGWICLKYTDYNAVIEDSAESAAPAPAVTVTGTVNVGSALNVRQSASASSARIGTLPNGTKVTMTSTKSVNGHKWGKLTSGGWICLDYVILDTTPSTNTSTNNIVSSGVTGTVVGTDKLNVRSAAGTKNDVSATLPEGTVVVVYEKTTVDNASWGRIDQGWVCLDYIKLNGVVSNTASSTVSATGTVSSSVSLNVRSGPGSDYGKIDALAPGAKVSIVEKQTVQGITWGKLASGGWVNMTYITMNNTGNGAYGVGGTVVNCSNGVNVRTGAGTTNALVGVIAVGSRVTITERKLVKGIYWGRTEKGWVCMDYIKLDSEFQDPKPEEDVPAHENTQSNESLATPGAGYPAVVTAETVLLAQASSDSKTLMTIHNGTDISITERKLVGTKEFGKVTIGSTTGWVNAADYSLKKVYGIITATEADGYDEANLRSKTNFSIVKNTSVEIVEQSFDGTRIWGKVMHSGRYLWINMADFTMYADNKQPAGLFTLSGVGYLTGSINASGTKIKKNTNGEPGAFMDLTLVEGYRVNVQSRLYNSLGETWGKIVVNNTACWVNMSNVDLDKVVMKATTNTLKSYTDYSGATEMDNLSKGDVLTVLERRVQPYALGINDWAKVYVNDNTADVRYIILDEGKLAYVTATTVDSGVSTSVLTGIVVIGKAKNTTISVYEEADSTSKTLININKDALVTILNWKNFGGKTWGKVQIGEIIGWVMIDDVDFTGLSGTIKVADLKVYTKADKDSSTAILKTNNATAYIDELSFDGKVLWGKVTIATHNGWIDLADVKLNAPTETDNEAVIATGKINSVSSNVMVYADLGVTPGDVKLPKDTKVSMLQVKLDSGKAWWLLELGENDGWVAMENLAINNTTITLVGDFSIDVTDDLVSGAKKMDTLYKGEKATAVGFKMYMGDLYAEVLCGDTTGWVKFMDSTNTTVFSMIPGAASSSPITPVKPVNPTEPTNGGNAGNTSSGTVAPAQGQAAYVVCNSTVNVRTAAGVANPLATTLSNGAAITVYEQTTVNGKGWARINEGWICMDYVKFGTNTSGTSASMPVVMTSVPAGAIAVGYANEDVKIREGAGMGYNVVATVKKNNSLVIYERKLEGGMSWGRTDSGWVCISYLTITAIGNSGGNMGTIARCGFTTNVRNTAGINGALMAKVMVTSRVVVYETTTVSGEEWARTDLGWISMNYIVMDANSTPAAAPAADNIG